MITASWKQIWVLIFKNTLRETLELCYSLVRLEFPLVCLQKKNTILSQLEFDKLDPIQKSKNPRHDWESGIQISVSLTLHFFPLFWVTLFQTREGCNESGPFPNCFVRSLKQLSPLPTTYKKKNKKRTFAYAANEERGWKGWDNRTGHIKVSSTERLLDLHVIKTRKEKNYREQKGCIGLDIFEQYQKIYGMRVSTTLMMTWSTVKTVYYNKIQFQGLFRN